MKSVICMLMALSLFAADVFAQDATGKKMSNLENLIVNGEKLLQYDSYETGVLSGSFDIRFTAMVITDPEKSEILAKGMKATIMGEKEATSSVYLDFEEVQNLSKSLSLIKAVSAKFADKKREPYTEVVYSSKGGFKFGYLNRGVNAGMFSSNSALFIKTPDMVSTLKDDEKRFNQLQSIVNNVLMRISRNTAAP